jgi:hypothetical protein
MKIAHFVRFVCGCLLGLLCVAYVAMGQTETATISGLVTDEGGGMVPNCEVVLQSVERGTLTTAKTNDAGIYVFASVQPGQYNLTIKRNGFKQVDFIGLIVNVQDHIEQNFRLQVGSVSESVTVTAGGLKINTTDASVSTVVERSFIENIPLNGRSLQPLIELTPGVLITPVTASEQGQFSVNGQRADANYFTVDGVSATFGVSSSGVLGQAAAGSLPGMNALGGTNSLVSIDAVQEFRIQTSSYAPEFGRTPGGQISIVTRSGTNQLHGALFDYFRNDALDANDWFADAHSLRKAPERQNDFGGVLGGPILKDRTFFFFSYEGLRLRQPATGSATYPTAAFRQSAAAAWIKPLLDALPIPNGAVNNDGCTASTPSGPVPCDAQFNASYSNPTTLNATSLRVDHKLNDRISIFGRYNYAPSESAQRVTASSYILDSKFPLQTATVGSTQEITSSMSNEFRFNYSLANKDSGYVADNLGGAVPPASSLLFPGSFSSKNSRFELVTLSAGSFLLGTFPSSKQRQINVVDGFTRVIRAHQLKFGVDYRRLTTHTEAEPFVQTIEFLSLGGPPFGVQQGGINFYNGVAHGNSVLSFQNFSLYAQDTWKLQPRVTLTYGVRWDVNPPFHATGAPGIYTVQNLNDPANLSLAPPGTPFYQTTWHNFAPRVGLAAQLSTANGFERVVRAGFGMFYDIGAGTLAQSFADFPNEQENPLVFKNIPFPIPTNIAVPPPFTTTIPRGGIPSISATEPNLDLPRTYQWNVALEQSLGVSQTLSVTYVGAIGRDLLRQFNLFDPNPNFQNVFILQNSATSDYHALQVQYQRRLSHGLQALGFYSWSHSIDEASNDSSSFGSNARLDRGNSDFDIRQAFHGVIAYNIPTPQIGSLGKAILGGWSVDTTGVVQSAPPIDLKSGLAFQGNANISSRPNVVPGQPFYLFGAQCIQVLGPPCAGGKGINPNAFTTPSAGQQGNLGRNVLRGFGLGQLDASVRRQFNFTERWNLQFSAEFFNILNHPNFGSSSIATNLSQFPGLFGQASQILASSLSPGQGLGGFNPLYQVGGPRSIQLALKLKF